MTCFHEVKLENTYGFKNMIIGEARPVAKRKGNIMIGGTVNEDGVVHVEATHVRSESALSHIVQLARKLHKYLKPWLPSSKDGFELAL